MFDKATGIQSAIVAKADSSESSSEGRFVVNVPIVASMAGASLCFAWVFGTLVLFSSSSAVGQFRLPFLVSFAIAYGVLRLFSDRLQRRRRALAVVSLACCLLPLLDPLLAFGANLEAARVLACCVAPGLGGAVAVTLWLESCCRLAPQRTRAVLSFSLLFATVLCGLVFAVEHELRPFFVAVLGAFSAAVYLAQWQAFSVARNLADVSAEDSDERSRITPNSIILTASNSLAQGFALYGMLDFGSNGSTGRVVCLLAFALFLCLAIDSLKAFIIRESIIRYLMLPLIATCLLLMVFMPESTWEWFCAAVLVVSLLPYTSAMFATCEHIVRDDLAPFRTVGKIRTVSTLGVALGWCAGWVAFPGGLLEGSAFGVSVAVLVIVLIVITIVFDQKSLYPGSEEGTPEEDGGEDARHGQWTRRCEAFAEEVGLTARETEVMLLLARGFSAELIQERLYISKSTVKCHTYNIYNKANVHSRTDLIRLIEAGGPYCIREQEKRSA